ncbi:NmrA family protein [Dickeya chrysanthemi Ech1591]|uniref:NmrA family protein n=1 Tax=Dickeya chrysanthemi (strain Ech1591) TaxID=561229 RepID=C6CJE4_DICC1|nr:NmrA/HSCARG family protein [Dickeya chrysanthemi]ACT07124.1 NmrA family protein [Dickeya chrysanthemi Ech1591]
MSNTISGSILVTGATGTQGGAVARALLNAGFSVRALVRDPSTTNAKALASLGVTLVKGDYDDVKSLDAAMDQVQGVFSVQMPPHPDDQDLEVRTGLRLLDVAHRSDVTMFVHSSVARAGDEKNFIDWESNRWWTRYWESKSAVNNAIADRGLRHWVILKPAMIMENFLPPKVRGMYPSLAQGKITTAILPETRLDMIAADDIGSFAVAAFSDPARFSGHSIDLAAESLTMEEVASALSVGTGCLVSAQSLTAAEAIAQGNSPGLVSSQIWDNLEGYRVDIQAAKSWGIPLTQFSQWVASHREALQSVIGVQPGSSEDER